MILLPKTTTENTYPNRGLLEFGSSVIRNTRRFVGVFVFLHRKLNPAIFHTDYIELNQKWVAGFIYLSMTYFPGLIQKIHATVQSPTSWLKRAFLGYSIGMSPIS